ncbi:MAG TPA: hypothetical protein VF972_09320, partial [Actinomycetota bacterium]
MRTRQRPPDPVGVSVRFERFPATIKGAFVLRGIDGNPHSVRLVGASVVRVPSGPSKAVPLDEVVVDVAPARDLFVPFEAGVSDLDPGWYSVECRIHVDGVDGWSFAGRPFPVAWPRGANRRGSVPLGRTVMAGARTFFLDRVELAADHATLLWRPDEKEAGAAMADDAAAVLLIDGGALEPLPGGVGGSPRTHGAERRSAFYPVPRTAAQAEVVVRLGTGEESD